MEYEGDLYRPPSEAHSLIIQVTIGCSHNKCTFCHMYTDKQFRIRTREEILRDLEECSALYGQYVRRVFFADGDALIVPTPLLLELLTYVKDHFPKNELYFVGMYTTLNFEHYCFACFHLYDLCMDNCLNLV